MNESICNLVGMSLGEAEQNDGLAGVEVWRRALQVPRWPSQNLE